MMEEVWKPIPGYGGHYEASSEGRIRSLDREVEKFSVLVGRVVKQHYKGKILKQCKGDQYGHLYVRFGVNKQKYMAHVARLVLLAFVGEPDGDLQARHLNGDAGDNRFNNLAWGTQLENNRDRKAHGRYAVGEKHHSAKLTPDDVLAIKASQENGVILSRRFGVGVSTISRIRRHESWVHLNG